MTQLSSDDAQSVDSTRPAPFVLSALLSGHAKDVRTLAAAHSPTSDSSQLLSGSRDNTARLWGCTKEHTGPTWGQERVWEDEGGWVNSVAFVPPRKDEDDKHGYLACAGQDSLIHLFPLSPSAPSSPTHTLLGHAHNVCAIHCSPDGRRIASASWDLTARVWSWRAGAAVGDENGAKGEWDCERVLVGHGAAVWDVLLLAKSEDLVLTACADGLIRLFEGIDVRYTFKGHEGPVRALAKVLPEDPGCALFASASNDGTIRLWNYQSGDSVTTVGSHDSFIYSLVSLPSTCGGGLASSGEDGIIRVWNEEDGEMDQEILIPALSVWSLAALPNGDLACAGSDGLIWLFSRDEKRRAGKATVEDYEGRLAELRASKTSSAGPKMEDAAALQIDGKKEGEVKLIRQDDKVQAYQWDGSSWQEIGEVVQPEPSSAPASGPPAPPRMEHKGTMYDYVFQIDVKDDEPPLPLPYNLDDDRHAVASAFVKQHNLPESYTDQIVDFIRASTTG
ncbi:hypothetical protein JCM10207_007431 [Rhodosporidiobolus poonsookiae]